MAPTKDYDITNDEELQTAVRHRTQYTQTELDDPSLNGAINTAKRILATEFGGHVNFYDDRGLTRALFGAACIEAKCRVENEATASYNLGNEIDVEVRDSDGNSLQVGRYESDIQRGMKNANQSRDVQMLGNTSGFIG